MTIDDSRVSRRTRNLRESAMPDYEQVKNLQPFALWSVLDRFGNALCVVVLVCGAWSAPLWTHEQFWIIRKNRIRRRRLQQRRTKPVIKIESPPAAELNRTKSIVVHREIWHRTMNGMNKFSSVRNTSCQKIKKIKNSSALRRRNEGKPKRVISRFPTVYALQKLIFKFVWSFNPLLIRCTTPSNANSNRLTFGCIISGEKKKLTCIICRSSHVVRHQRTLSVSCRFITLLLLGSRFSSISIAHCFRHVHSISYVLSSQFHFSLYRSLAHSRDVFRSMSRWLYVCDAAV